MALNKYKIEKPSIPAEVLDTVKTLKNKGFEAYLIGGCVRDILLGKKPKDWDITTDATPEEIIPLFKDTFYENNYGTVGIVNEEAKDETLKAIEKEMFEIPAKLKGTYTNALQDKPFDQIVGRTSSASQR